MKDVAKKFARTRAKEKSLAAIDKTLARMDLGLILLQGQIKRCKIILSHLEEPMCDEYDAWLENDPAAITFGDDF